MTKTRARIAQDDLDRMLVRTRDQIKRLRSRERTLRIARWAVGRISR